MIKTKKIHEGKTLTWSTRRRWVMRMWLVIIVVWLGLWFRQNLSLLLLEASTLSVIQDDDNLVVPVAMVQSQNLTTKIRTSHTRPLPKNSFKSSQSENQTIIPITTFRSDAMPLVMESHKLIFIWFPKVGCTIWKKLFRRMLGYTDWKEKNPHYRKDKIPSRENGLVYIDQFDTATRTQWMNTKPEWTVAMFLRDPKDRLLSAYLDKLVLSKQRKGFGRKIRNCCTIQRTNCTLRMQRRKANPISFADFVQIVLKGCPNNHWDPQSQLLPIQYLPTVNFVGYMGTLEQDAKRLLEKIGAWDEYGASGWGFYGNESIFASKSMVAHKTSEQDALETSSLTILIDPWDRLARYYTPEIEQQVEQHYANDYQLLPLPVKKVRYS